MGMNSEKSQLGQETVSFAGMEITKDAIRPAREYLDAIRNFPVPKNISLLRSFYGMINQINYAFLMTEHMEPFRHLLKSDTPYFSGQHKRSTGTLYRSESSDLSCFLTKYAQI